MKRGKLRLGPHETVEYFTVGAGLETSRTNQKVQPWYFTTAARVGIDFTLTQVGTEAPRRDVLEQRLADCAAAGLPGQVHPDADAHRTRVNQVLFGLDRYKFDALRKALLQLRRPKLSDKLSERGLAEILRDSLAPLDTHLVESIAGGYERLDRRHNDVKGMRTTLTALQTLENCYTEYARAALLLRATTVLDAAEATARAASAAAAEAAECRRLTGQAEDVAKKIDAASAEIVRLSGHLDGLKLRDEFTEGADLEPRREQAEQLERAAAASAERAHETQGQAEQDEASAQSLAQEREAALLAVTATRDLLDEAAQTVQLVHDTHLQWTAQLDAVPATGDDGELERLRLQVRNDAIALRDRVSELQRLVRQASDAADKANSADTDVATARQVLGDAKRATEEAARQLDQARRAHLRLLQDWLNRSPQLRQGLASPPLDDETPHHQVAHWAAQAFEARSAQLGSLEEYVRQADAERAKLTSQLA